MQDDARTILHAYYAAFNAGDPDGMLALMTDDVVHDINQGGRETGRVDFARFMARMNRCYREQIRDLVVMVDPTGTRAAAEFIVDGTYLATDEGLPVATGQTYSLPGGAFFALRRGRIARVSNWYNLPDWLRQVGA